jgi:chromosome segregation ATPase
MAPDLNKSSSEVSAKSLASGQAKTYKSPQRKLVRFFEKSRNQWKSKFRDAKVVIKRLQNRIRFLEKSKARDQHRIRELESTLKDMKTQVRVIEKEFSDFKEKYLTEKTDSGKSLTVFRQPLSYHIALAM